MIKKRFEVLDSFRGLCALGVAVNHMRFSGSLSELDFFRNAGLFVEFFFVLSGFVLAHSYAFKDSLSFRAFAVSRTFRLYPLHLAMFIAVVVLELSKLAMAQAGYTFNTAPFTELKAVEEIIPNLLLVHAWTEYTAPVSFNGPSWSISIEYYTYMIFFATLVLFTQNRIAIWVVISSLFFVSMIFSMGLLVPFAQRGLSCFFAGTFVYYLYRNYFHAIRVNVSICTLLELFTLLAVVWIVASDIAHRGIFASLLFCVAVLLFSLEAGAVSRALKKQLFQYLGKLSYSIYMTHAPLLFYFTASLLLVDKLTHTQLIIDIDEQRYFSMGNVSFNNLMILVLCMAIILVSHFTYMYIEKPGQILGKKFR